MKTKILILTLFALFSFGFAGCYTVIWSPDMQFPTQADSGTEVNNYYSYNYYGDYNYYYAEPWWYSLAPPAYIAPTKERTNADERLRNNTGGRGTSARDIIRTAPPSRNSNPPAVAPPSHGNTGSSMKTESQSGNTRSQSSSSNNNLRNNDGSRKSDNGRR